MKCPNCGAEIKTESKFCEFCGTQISYAMQREQEQLNKQGCPKCGSSNIQFKRENHGEVRQKNTKRVIHRTVGFCKDCGHTWYPNKTNETPKNNNMILWVLGWLFFFPAPVMVLIWRKKNTWDIKIKIAVTVVFWLFILVGGRGNKTNTSISNQTDIVQIQEITTADEQSEINTSKNTTEEKFLLELQANVPNEYSREITLNADTQNALTYLGYFVPAGIYNVTNLGEYMDNIFVYTNETQITDGWEEPAGETHNIMLDVGSSAELEVGENQYIKIVEPSHIQLEMQQ